MRVAFTIAAVALAIASPAVLFAAGTGRQHPYSSLFSAQLNGSPTRQVQAAPPRGPQFIVPQQASRTARAPKVVCGMTVMEGDSKIDPTIAHHLPKDGSKAVITTVEPKICRR